MNGTAQHTVKVFRRLSHLGASMADQLKNTSLSYSNAQPRAVGSPGVLSHVRSSHQLANTSGCGFYEAALGPGQCPASSERIFGGARRAREAGCGPGTRVREAPGLALRPRAGPAHQGLCAGGSRGVGGPEVPARAARPLPAAPRWKAEDGQIYCGLVTCPELVCASSIGIPDSCCPVCKDTSYEKSVEEEPLQLNRGVRHSQEQCSGEMISKKFLGATASTAISSSLGFNPRSFKQKAGGTTIKIYMKEKHKKACVYNGKTYSHGEVWHPVFRSFGTLPCILCSCKDGQQECQRITCPEEYPCAHPEKVEGKCCKICQEPKVQPTDEINPTKCVKNQSKVSVYMYMSPQSESRKENVRKIAIEKESSDDVDIYVWKMVKGIFHLVQIKKVGKQEFKREAHNFRLVTRTSEGNWNAFKAPSPSVDLKMTESPEKETKNL
ncbi:hypothetical protein NDU88_008579 [Pleurodeles waltl]|uniref:VWFC domain-containing protein n=1 Tax=Pleurodeles waltl TaxID=8319 RepID=A0AAV7P5G9_PLEWA|nr:hypothetical protein NDU88_008579 [Pleurodeles waltl]